MTKLLFFILLSNFLKAEESDWVCVGPMSCGEDVGQKIGAFGGSITKDLSGVPDLISETDLKAIETKLGNGAGDSILSFDKAYTDKMGAEAPLPVTRAFVKYRLKLNVDDRDIDFINTSENKSLGLSGPESKPKDMVDVSLPQNTKPLQKSQLKPRGKKDSE